MEQCQCHRRQAAAITLVGQGRIREAIADHPVAALERRPDGLDQMIAARRHHQQRLGLGVPTLRRAFDEKPADLFRPRRAAGLARLERRLPGLTQGFDQESGVGGFARALAAFEGDEAAATQRLPQTR